MRFGLLVLASLILAISLILAGCKSAAPTDELAVLETNYGKIVIEFYSQDAPKNVENFQQLARNGFFDGTKFHRLVKTGNKFVAIQGGDPNTINGDPSTWGQGQPWQKPVVAEFSKTMKHVRGIVSAARKSNDENSATSQFFICTGAEPQWDGKYSIFGHVIEGMNVADSIVRAPLWPNTDRPMDPVTVTKVTLIPRSSYQPPKS